MDSTETLKKFARHDGSIRYSDDKAGETGILQYLNERIATLVSGEESDDAENKQSWTAAIANCAATINNVIFASKPA
eukprot:COSAG02_NODE_6738_length_3393_cov_2.353673_4_plen_76_part_01